MRQAIGAQPGRVAGRGLVDPDALADSAQLELVADADPDLLGKRLGQRDLELSSDLGHESIHPIDQGLRQGAFLD
jgi:hypothetical protein